MDGRNPLVTGYYRRRIDAILKCAFVALRFGFKVLAVQHQGWCATGPRAHLTYRKYGRSSRCKNGKGGPWANDVYVISGEWDFLNKDVTRHDDMACVCSRRGHCLANSWTLFSRNSHGPTTACKNGAKSYIIKNFLTSNVCMCMYVKLYLDTGNHQ